MNNIYLKNIEVVESIIHPNKKSDKAFILKRNESNLMQVWLSLRGKDVPFVHYVIYRLHSSFPKPNNKVVRNINNQNCRFSFWTWGLFEVEIIIKGADGNSRVIHHQLNYDKQINDFQEEFGKEGFVFVNNTSQAPAY